MDSTLMTPVSDIHATSARLQKEIQNHLGLKGDNLVFEFRQIEGQTILDLITVNPRHQQSFLFHSEKALDKIDALKKMLIYVKTYKEKDNSYTIQWSTKGGRELQTSYFRAGNVYEALDKLYYGRDMNVITVFSVVLNPVT
jgi:hypothetical protein